MAYQTFQQLIQRDSDICNNCFRLTHVTVERNVAVDTFDGELWFREVDLPARSWPRYDQTQYIAGVLASDGTHRGCLCGCDATIRPVSKGTAMGHVERIIERLQEKGVDVDPDVLRIEAWHRLGRPAWQGKQDELFGTAVELACQRSTTRSAK
jgi:hypothetical protein